MFKNLLREWLHYAALAAEAFTGQPNWQQPVYVKIEDAHKLANDNQAGADFAPILRAAD